MARRGGGRQVAGPRRPRQMKGSAPASARARAHMAACPEACRAGQQLLLGGAGIAWSMRHAMQGHAQQARPAPTAGAAPTAILLGLWLSFGLLAAHAWGFL